MSELLKITEIETNQGQIEGLPDNHPCEITRAKEWIDKVLDHRHLNDVVYFNPTAELLAKFIFEKFSGVSAFNDEIYCENRQR